MSRAICKTCTQGFDYPTRRGRPPATCPACAEGINETKAERQARKEKKAIQRAEREMDLAYDYVHPEKFYAELEESRRTRYEAFAARVADIHTMPSYEVYYKIQS
jgi:hypothetical protein